MGMYERAGLLNGSLEIQSKPGEGTKVVVKLPWYVQGKEKRVN